MDIWGGGGHYSAYHSTPAYTGSGWARPLPSHASNSFHQPHEEKTVTKPILQTRKLRFREGKSVYPGHTEIKKPRPSPNCIYLSPDSVFWAVLCGMANGLFSVILSVVRPLGVRGCVAVSLLAEAVVLSGADLVLYCLLRVLSCVVRAAGRMAKRSLFRCLVVVWMCRRALWVLRCQVLLRL